MLEQTKSLSRETESDLHTGSGSDHKVLALTASATLLITFQQIG